MGQDWAGAGDLFERIRVGDVVAGVVSGLTSYGAFIDLGGGYGLIHVSELSPEPVRRVADVVQLGRQVKARVISVDPAQNRIMVSLKQVAGGG